MNNDNHLQEQHILDEQSMRDKSISLLGSTGSIGRQTLEVSKALRISVRALSADKNISLLEEQTRRFMPAVVAVTNEKAAKDFKTRVRDLDIKVISGTDSLIEASCVDEVDIVVTAVVGMAGLLPTLAAIALGRSIALANKETLVCAGELVMTSAAQHGAHIIPVDSEHSAIMQCIEGSRPDSIKRLILTASGGPFLGMSRQELTDVTPEMALRHPTWSMGQKVTIDSATLMNKGFEVIEASHLFGISPNNITVLVHPESIIHSMVEFNDNSVIAQLAQPDMRLPIQNALTYPSKIASQVSQLDLSELSTLTFKKPDMEAFPCLQLAIDTVNLRGTAGSILNGANEAAVELFLSNKLSFYGIYEAVLDAIENIKNVIDPSIDDIIDAGIAAKDHVLSRVL